MKTNTKLVLGIFTAIAVIAFIIVWDLVIKENIESTQVVIIKPGIVIQKYETIGNDDVLIEKRNRATIVEGYIKPEELTSIMGMPAAQTLVGNQIISKRYIDFENLEPNPEKGEAIRPIPNQWIFAVPSTLRRKDNINIYLVASQDANQKTNNRHSNQEETGYVGLSPEQDLTNAEDAEEEENKNQEHQDERESIANTKKLSLRPTNFVGEHQEVLDYRADRDRQLEAKGLTEDTWEEFVRKGDIPVLVNIPVAYAKDGSGNEIHSGEKANSDDRLTSSGTIVNLELLLNEDNHRLLMNFVQAGYRLYITYN